MVLRLVEKPEAEGTKLFVAWTGGGRSLEVLALPWAPRQSPSSEGLRSGRYDVWLHAVDAREMARLRDRRAPVRLNAARRAALDDVRFHLRRRFGLRELRLLVRRSEGRVQYQKTEGGRGFSVSHSVVTEAGTCRVLVKEAAEEPADGWLELPRNAFAEAAEATAIRFAAEHLLG